MMGGFSIGGMLIFAALIYFVPVLVAFLRHHHNRLAILMLNIFLGWTFLGWVAALVWASTRVERDVTPPASQAKPQDPAFGKVDHPQR